MDAVGGPSFRTSYELLNPGGRLIAFGASAVMSGEKRNVLTAARAALRMPRFNLIKQMSASKAVIGLNMLTLWDHAGTLEPWIDTLTELMDDGTIQPVIAAGGAVRPRARGAPDARRAPQRREGRPHTVIARRPASATSSPSRAASGAQASAALTPTCSTTTPASQAPTALPPT